MVNSFARQESVKSAHIAHFSALVLIAAMMILSCAKGIPDTPAGNDERVLTVVPPEGVVAKTSIAGRTPIWCAGDRILVSNGKKSVILSVRQEDILPDGSFVARVAGLDGNLCLAYPAECAEGFSDGQLTLNFPESSDGSFASANISAAVVHDGEETAVFRNLGAVLRIRINRELAGKTDKLEIKCPGISGKFVTSTQNITLLSPVASSLKNSVEVKTEGKDEIYVGIPPISINAGAEFIFKDKEGQAVYARVTTTDNMLKRNQMADISFTVESVRLIKSSSLGSLWHTGDKVVLSDGSNVETYTIKASDIATDGSVSLSTQLFVRDHTLKAVFPSSAYKGIDDNGNILIDIPNHPNGSMNDVDITCAECKNGTLTFVTAAPIVKLKGLPGAAKSLKIDAPYISGEQKMTGGTITSCATGNHSELYLDLTQLSSSVYCFAISPSATRGTIHYFDDHGKEIGSNSIVFHALSEMCVQEYGPLRDVASINLGNGMENWLGYYPDDAMIPDLIMLGTHDSGTYGYSGILSSSVKCQSIDFPNQLKKGVRCFDLRLSENMNVFHGSFFCDVSIRDFFDACVSFLKNHPREVVFCFAKDENAEGDESVWNTTFLSRIDEYGRDKFVIDKNLISCELSQLRGKIVIISRQRSVNSFGYIAGAPQIGWPDNTWTTYTSGGDIHIALEDNYKAEHGNPKKNKILEFLNAIQNDEGYMSNGHRTRWIVAYTSGYCGYLFDIPYPESFCEDLLDTGIISTLHDNYDGLICDGITFFHDFIGKWDSYNTHLFNNFVRKK